MQPEVAEAVRKLILAGRESLAATPCDACFEDDWLQDTVGECECECHTEVEHARVHLSQALRVAEKVLVPLVGLEPLSVPMVLELPGDKPDA